MPPKKKDVREGEERDSHRGSHASKPPDNAQRRGIQSAEIGFRVLAALASEPEPSPLGSIARKAGLSPSQAHRYLASLVTSGMARQDTSSGRYELGQQAIQIGLAALARIDVFAEADAAIAAFTHESGRTALLAARGPLGPTIVRWHAGRMPTVTSLAIGSVLPLFNSATGFAFLAFMNNDEISSALLDTRPKLGRDRILEIRERVRRDMFATVDELLIPGLRAFAVPIFDIQGRAALVATAIATPAFPRKEDGAILQRLQDSCRRVTERIGARWAAIHNNTRIK